MSKLAAVISPLISKFTAAIVPSEVTLPSPVIFLPASNTTALLPDAVPAVILLSLLISSAFKFAVPTVIPEELLNAPSKLKRRE